MKEKKLKCVLRQTNGITIIALIITIIVMLILVTVGIEYGTQEVEKAKLEDLKTTMLLIKGRAQIVADKESFGESYNNDGRIKVTDETASKYNMSNLQDLNQTNLYIWEQIAMDNNNIDVTITTTEFYVIDYNTREVYYSLGYTSGDTTYYSLTDIQKIGEN